MLREPATKEMQEQWKQIFEKYKDRLKPNRKCGMELVNYLSSKYNLEKFKDEEADKVVYLNIMLNESLRNKLPPDKDPDPVTFFWSNNGEKVFIGVDLVSGFYHVEDDENLWDELYAFRGIDEADLSNYYCVAEYIMCLKKFDMLEEVLG